MLPSNGWLDQSQITGGIPYEGPLPEEHVGTYYEGGDGVMLGSTELDFRQANIIFELSFIRERFGFAWDEDHTDLTTMLSIQMVQDAVFGVLLLDSFTPPLIGAEFFEFIAYQQLACQGLLGEEVPFGACPEGFDAVESEAGSTAVITAEVLPTTPTFSEPVPFEELIILDAGEFLVPQDSINEGGTFGQGAPRQDGGQF
jgi:hypothetical protein